MLMLRFIRKSSWKRKFIQLKVTDYSKNSFSMSQSQPSTESKNSVFLSSKDDQSKSIKTVLQRKASKCENGDEKVNETVYFLEGEKAKNKIKKIKNFWDKNTKIIPHIFKTVRSDLKNKNLVYQFNDLGLKGTNQKGLEEKQIGKNYVPEFIEDSIDLNEKENSDPFESMIDPIEDIPFDD